MTVALDASALLAFVFAEPGGATTGELLDGSIVSAVNLSETIAKMIDRGWSEDDVRTMLARLPSRVCHFGGEDAARAGFLRAATRARGLSLGDRACLALAMAEHARVLTADRAWAGLDVGVEIEVIR